jgi:virginiamycin A acetyltransferase
MNNVDESAKISTLADIEKSVRGSGFSVGASSVIDSFVKVKFAGGLGDIEIGEGVYINSGCVLYSGNGIKIGDHVAVAANVVFAPVNHQYADKNLLIKNQGFLPSKGGIIIEDDVWIGAGCVILDGACIRRGAVIGAMSLVRGEVAANSVQGGNPLQFKRWRE